MGRLLSACVLAITAATAFSASAEPEKYRPAPYSWAVIAKDGIGCAKWEDQLALEKIAYSGDDHAFIMFAAANCKNLPKGTLVYIEDISVWHGLFQVRPKGGLTSYWTPQAYSWEPAPEAPAEK